MTIPARASREWSADGYRGESPHGGPNHYARVVAAGPPTQRCPKILRPGVLMSRELALDTIYLRPTSRLAHTDYSLSYHAAYP